MKRLLTSAALTVAMVAPAMAEKWTMTSVWPSSLELIEIDKHWVETVKKLVDPDKLTNRAIIGGNVFSGQN